MKFTTKLYLGFGIILLVVLFLLGIIMNTLSTMNDRIEQVVADRYEKVKLATAIRYEVGNIDHGLVLLLLNGPEGADAQIQQINNSRAQAEAAYTVLQKKVQLPQAVNAMKQIADHYSTFIRGAQQVIDLNNSGHTQEAQQLMQASVKRMSADLIKSVNELNKIQEGLMEGSLSESRSAYQMAQTFFFTFMIVCVPVLLVLTIWVIRSITKSMDRIAKGITSVSLDSPHLPRLEVRTQDKLGEIASAFNNMAETIEGHVRKEEEFVAAIQQQSLLKTKVAEISTMYQGIQDLKTLAQQFLGKIAPLIDAQYGVFYLREGEGEQVLLHKLAGYASSEGVNVPEHIAFGEGLLGQCALENRTMLLTNVPSDYLKISSSLGEASPASIWMMPIDHEGEVIGVVEFATFNQFTQWHQELLEQVLDTLGVTIGSIASHMQVKRLLGESQTLTEELQAQSEELQLQQEELKSINEMLEEQYKNSELKTKELEEVRVALEEKARQLEFSSNYKSEFLANMSHELRTPLNSLLILAQMLTENMDGNLTAKQIEYASTIYASGNDLLFLINDILDLSKIESGKMEIVPGEVTLSDIQAVVERDFQPVARKKGLSFEVDIQRNIPQILFTDEQRLHQILKNLLSNAFKFTHTGGVTLRVQAAEQDGQDLIAFAVEDTGIGIPPEKQQIVFEAFKQADGTTSRKYGGTGLGLSISREIAHLFGGRIELQSQEGIGSTFTLFLPVGGMQPRAEAAPGSDLMPQAAEPVEHTLVQEDTLQPAVTELLQGKTVLIIDDDMRNIFALTAALESQRMSVLFAENGAEGLKMLDEHPEVDIVLMDIMMPEMDGYQAMRRIREMPEHEHLPIIALTAKAMKHDRERCIEAGASDYISKPVNNDQLFSLMRVWLYR